jgi:MFS transporter, ceroid-lipofuscinosis neuronal protein 7
VDVRPLLIQVGLIVSLVICLLGNIIYMAADASATNSLAVLVVSRFIVGFGGGSRSVCRANVAALTTVDQRLKYITILAAVVFLGYALTPGLGSLVARTDMEVGGVQFNKFTSPGAILVALNIVTLVAIVFVFDDSVSIVDCPEETSAQSDQRQQRSATTREPVVVGERAIAIGAVLFIFLNFTAKGTLAVFETVNIPLYFQVTHSDPASNDTVVEASNFQFYLGLLGLITYVSIDILRDKITAIQWVYIGFTTLLVGNVMLVIAPSSLTYWRLVIAETFVWSVGCPITTAVVVAAFSRLLGTRPQGFLMGLLGSAGSMARITLPLLPAALPSMTAVFGFNIAFCVLGMSCLLCYARIAFRSAAQAELERDLEKAPVKLTISDDSDSGRTTDSEDGLPEVTHRQRRMLGFALSTDSHNR